MEFNGRGAGKVEVDVMYQNLFRMLILLWSQMTRQVCWLIAVGLIVVQPSKIESCPGGGCLPSQVEKYSCKRALVSKGPDGSTKVEMYISNKHQIQWKGTVAVLLSLSSLITLFASSSICP